MLLKSLCLKNIRSYTDETIEFPEGSTLLAGDIGSGKSTVLLAIDFALFGLSRTELEGSDLLRHGKSFGAVELEFELDGKTYKVKRTLKRSGDSIVQDSSQFVVDNRLFNWTPTELKAKILELLGYPLDFLRKNKPVFRYTVYTPQEQMKHILLSTDRLEILRKIFNVDKYGQIKNNSRLFIAELRSMKRELESFSKDLEDKLKIMEDLRYTLNNLRREAYTEREQLHGVDRKLQEKTKEIEGIKAKIEETRQNRKEKEKKEIEIAAKINRAGRAEKDIAEMAEGIENKEKEILEIDKTEKPEKGEKEISTLIAELERERKNLLHEKAVTESDIAKLSKILEDGLCTVCGQRVHNPMSFGEGIEERRRENQELEKKADAAENELANLRRQERIAMSYASAMERRIKEEKDLAVLSSKMAILEKEKSELEKDIQIIRNTLEFLESKIFESRHLDELWKNLEAELQAIQAEKLAMEKRISKIEQQMEDIESHITSLEKEIEEKRKSRQRISIISELVSWLDDYFLNLMDTIEKHVMYAIQSQFNEYFQSWFSMLMNDEQLSARIGGGFEPLIEQNGYDTEYQNLSGGEKTAVALAYRLALNRVMNDLIETMKTRDIIILDEPTDGFSSDQLDRIRYVLNELKLRQVIIVSHEPKIDTFVDNVIRICKEEHVSRVMR